MNPVHRLIELYKISESTLTGLIPNLSDEEIVQFISSNRWVVIPTSYEKGKKESINRPDPNMYISLRHEGKIELGLVCNTLASIQRMKNIFSDFHSQDKGLLIEKLGRLDDDFKTTLEKKLKPTNYAQTPIHEVDSEVQSNTLDEKNFKMLFERAEEILEEGRAEMKNRGIHWLPISPHLHITTLLLEENNEIFKEKLKKLKPVYEIALRIKTDEQINEITEKAKQELILQKQLLFRQYVEELKNKGVTGEEYRRLTIEWQKLH
jgi:hypothetical protein